MKSFFKFLFASILGVILGMLLFFFILMGIVGSMVSSGDKVVKVKPNSVLLVKLDQTIVDRSSDNPFDNFNFNTFESEPKLGLNDVLEGIKKAKTDENIKGILLQAEAFPSGFATVEEIRNALIDFKTSGKFLYAYGDYFTQKSYYLNSVADKIYITPEGGMELKGLSTELMFFKGTLEKLGLEPIIIRHGKFKSAVEPFMYDKMSPENREQISAFIGSFWNHYVAGVSASRAIEAAEINRIADNILVTSPESAIENKMIDGMLFYDQLLDTLKVKTGAEKDVEFIGLGKYKKTAPVRKEKRLPKKKVAVIYAAGEIGMGKGGEQAIGSEGLSKTIREARLDTTIKAIVLRVNSPGGSALASEIIYREMVLAAKVKPVIASMGDVAASGGYYIACPADTIVASPNTVTGSIGVFGLMFNGQKLLKDKLGITVDRVTTNKYSDLGSFTRSMSAEEQSIIQKEVEKVYDTFIGHVALGRGMTKEEVDNIGQGRVWSGVTAQSIGLVDVLGGLNDAIRIAVEKAKLGDDYRVVSLPKQEDPFEQIIKSIGGDAKMWFMKEELGETYQYLRHIESLTKMEGTQARLPFSLEVY